jgi:hypothetical protein
MHVFLYEWVTGGGLSDEPGPLPPSLLAEGSAMLTALAADFVAGDGAAVTVLRDMRLEGLALPGCKVIDVHSAADAAEEFDRLAADADHTLVVAPEFDGILRRVVRKARDSGARLLNCSEQFVAITADKHKTAALLSAAGLPTPRGVLLDADDERLPADFAYPAVLKPNDGAGSQHALLIGSAGDEPPPHPWPRRLEEYREGRPASVAFICGTAGQFPLPACWQHLSGDGRFTYRGGAIIRESSLADRATGLAARGLAALPPAHGFVGVDLVLGSAVDGSDDVIIEINPRLTTSYVGLRAAVGENLGRAMVDVANGSSRQFALRDPSIHFSSDGNVWTAP